MKIKLLIAGMLFTVTSYSQIQPATYESLGDTIQLFGTWKFTRLHINEDKTFRIEYRTGLSCFLWVDIYGNWTTDGNKLILEDNALDFNSDKNRTVKRKTIYLISSSDLIFQEQKTDRFALLSGNQYFGNYRKAEQ